MPIFSSLIGGGLSLLGGLMGNDAQADAARQAAEMARFRPYNVSGAGGEATFDGQNLSLRGDATTQDLQGLLSGRALDQLAGGGFGSGAIGFANDVGSNMLPGLFGGALEASQMIPTGAFNQFANQANQNAQFGFGAGQNFLGQAAAFGSSQRGINDQLAQGLFGRAGSLFDQDFSNIRDEQLSIARNLARPAEDRAVNSKFQNLFNRGALSQTGGERQIGELALAQEQADYGRQLGSSQFANQLLQQNRQFGQGLLGSGLQARGLDQSFNLGAGGLMGNLGANLLNFGGQQAGAGLNALTNLSNLQNSRGQQRLQNATSLLGFGGNLNQSNLNQSLGLLSGYRGLNADLRQLGALGGNLGQAGSNAGANAGQLLANGTGGSPVGSALSGLGSAVGASNMSLGDFSSLFKPASTELQGYL